MTTSNNHDEYAAAAAQPNQGGSMKPYLKGLYAALVAFAGGVTAAQADGITGTEWTTIGVATVFAAVGVFYVPYKSTRPTPPAG
jgi:hypothetical protein